MLAAAAGSSSKIVSSWFAVKFGGAFKSGEKGERRPLTKDFDSVLVVQKPPGVCGKPLPLPGVLRVVVWTPPLLVAVEETDLRVRILGFIEVAVFVAALSGDGLLEANEGNKNGDEGDVGTTLLGDALVGLGDGGLGVSRIGFDFVP